MRSENSRTGSATPLNDNYGKLDFDQLLDSSLKVPWDHLRLITTALVPLCHMLIVFDKSRITFMRKDGKE